MNCILNSIEITICIFKNNKYKYIILLINKINKYIYCIQISIKNKILCIYI